RAVYSPTQYIWRKQNPVPTYFTFVRSQTKQINQVELEKNRLRKNLSEYLDTLPRNQSSPSDLDRQETSYVSSLNQMFDELQPAPQVTPSNEEIVVATPNIRVRKMMPETALITEEK